MTCSRPNDPKAADAESNAYTLRRPERRISVFYFSSFYCAGSTSFVQRECADCPDEREHDHDIENQLASEDVPRDGEGKEGGGAKGTDGAHERAGGEERGPSA